MSQQTSSNRIDDDKTDKGASGLLVPVIRPNHSRADVRIFTDGLSVLCRNDREGQVEIAFVLDDHSPVEICAYKTNTGDIVGRYQCPPNHKCRIEISKTYRMGIGTFYEDGLRYSEDFGWMPDLSVWHNEVVSIDQGAEQHFSAKLVIWDAVYYNATAMLRPGNSHRFGRQRPLPDWAGARSRCRYYV